MGVGRIGSVMTLSGYERGSYERGGMTRRGIIGVPFAMIFPVGVVDQEAGIDVFLESGGWRSDVGNFVEDPIAESGTKLVSEGFVAVSPREIVG